MNQFVRAGAGAGKTWNLTRQVIHRALDHHQETGQWPRTVLTTFTRKATQELKERLLIYCLQEKPEALEFVQSSSFLTITTMHGLFNRFLSQYGHALGLASQFQVVDSSQVEIWKKQILKDLVSSEKIPTSLSFLDFKRFLSNLKNFETVYWQGDYRPTSKEDIKKLMNQICMESSIALSKIGSEASDWVEGEKWEDFLHKLAQITRALEAESSWGEKNKSVETLMTELKKPRKSKNNPGLPEHLDAQLKKQLEKLKKIIQNPEYQEEHWAALAQALSDFDTVATEFCKKLMAKKVKEASLEADDLELYSLHILKTRPDLVEQFAEGCDAWFIDEFQDTSPLQLEILNTMIGKSFCYVVGDPQQSIYLFRGSRSEVFFEKQKQMGASGAEMLFLQNNYRSQENLLKFINDFFPKIDSSFASMDPIREPEADAHSCVMSVISSEEPETELNHITQQIAELLKNGANPKDICILSRTRKSLDRTQKELLRLGYPVISHASSNYYGRREVLDAMALLHFLMNPWNNESLVLLMRSPWTAFSDEKILSIIERDKDSYWPLFKDYFEKHPDYTPGQVLLEAIQKKDTLGVGWVFRKCLLKLGFIDFTQRIDSTGRREANLWKLINLVEKTSREKGGSLLKLAKEGATASLLEEIGDSSDANSPVEPNKINLMTIHASKGLQFKYVFMPFLNKKPRETTFQDFSTNEDSKHWSFRMPAEFGGGFVGGALETLFVENMKRREAEESLRLLYVGITRAEEKLFLSWAAKTEKNSWAEVLVKYFENADLSLFQMLEVTEAEPVGYEDASANEVIRSPYQGNGAGFSFEADDARVEAPTNFQTWDEIESAQKKRWQGVVLHRLFESLKHHSREQVNQLADLWLAEDKDRILAALDFVENCEDVPMKRIIEQGEVEWGYQRDQQGQLIERRIDLWGIVDDTLWIVDYKTGSSSFKDKAFEQMTEYQKALTEYLGWDKEVKKVALYPFSQEVFKTLG